MVAVRHLGIIVAIASSLTVAGSPAAAGQLDPSPPGACDERCGSLEGRLRTAGNRTAIVDATIIVIPADPNAKVGPTRPAPVSATAPLWERSTHTDEAGRFELTDIPPGKIRVVAVAGDHARLDYIETVQPGQQQTLKLFAQPDEASQYRTVVRSTNERRAHPTSTILSAKEIETLPGAQGDPLRALQNLPGVARAPANLGLLVLRGAAPAQSRVYFGGHAIPRAFHILSLATVFPTQVIDQLEYVPGNFDAAYGNATGGIVVIEPRKGTREGYHGYAEIDLAAAGALVEGPIGRGSFVLAAQRGYIDGVVALADRVIEQTTGSQESFLRPAYYDYQALLDYPAGPGANVGLRIFGSGDRIRGDSTTSGFDQSEFDFRGGFHRLDVVYTKRGRGRSFRLTPSFRFETNRYTDSIGSQRRRRFDYVLSTRAEFDQTFSRHFSLIVGTDFEFNIFSVRDQTAVTLGSFSGDASEENQTGTESSTGVYSTANIQLGPVTFRPGMRASAFTAQSQSAFGVDPRLNAHIDIDDKWRIGLGAGRYTQARSIRESESVDLVGQGGSIGDGNLFVPAVFSRFDPEINFAPADRQFTVRSAWQLSAGFRYSFGNGFSASATGFFRETDNGTPVFFSGSVVGFSLHARTAGLEVLIRKQLTKKLYGWIAYTWSRSRVRFLETADLEGQFERPSDFDQPHNLIVVASYALPKNWRIGGRFRLVSGYPFTPVVGSIALPGGRNPLLGQRNADRLPPFHQLDLRVDKRWILRRLTLSAYMDIQNVYNRQNPEATVYSADYREQIGFVGIPIYPSFGFRIDY